MPNSYGDYNPSEPNTLADGKVHDAAVRAYTKTFDLANDEDAAGGTTNLLHVGRVRAGSCLQPEFKIASTANLSAINFTLGTLADGDAFMAATAGPNATTASYHILPAMQGVPFTVDTDIYLTPSGNLAASGTVVSSIYASHR